MRTPSRARILGVLALAVVGISLAAPIVRWSLAESLAKPLAIAFWRMTFSALLTSALWVASSRADRRRPDPRYGSREWALAGLAGLLLAVHFGTWISSLSFISVTASVVLVNTQPIFAALWASLFLKELPTRLQWIGIGVAVLGATFMSLGSGGEGSLLGHFLALVGAATLAAYYVVGRSLRRSTSLWAYVTRVYGVSAVALLGGAIVAGSPLVGYPAGAWAVFLALALGPSLLGHTLLNWSLRWLSASLVNVVSLGESVGAALLAFLWFGEVPSQLTVAGGAVTLLGIALVLWKREAGPPVREEP